LAPALSFRPNKKGEPKQVGKLTEKWHFFRYHNF
jgi:hypothetical protein